MWFKAKINIWLKAFKKNIIVLLLLALMYRSVSQDGSAWSNLPSYLSVWLIPYWSPGSRNELEMQIWWKGSHQLGRGSSNKHFWVSVFKACILFFFFPFFCPLQKKPQPCEVELNSEFRMQCANIHTDAYTQVAAQACFFFFFFFFIASLCH